MTMTENLNTRKFTKATIDELKPALKDYFIWDTELKNFGVKVTRKGRKTYVVSYRIAGVGNSKRITIGVHGEIYVKQARLDAANILNQARRGIDPAADLKSIKTALVFDEAFNDFFERHIKIKLKQSTIDHYETISRLHLKPTFGGFKLKDISRDHISKHHDRFVGQPANGNKQLAVLSKFFNWCEAHDLIESNSNPCKHVKKFKEKTRERYLDEDELVRLHNVLASAVEKSLANQVAVNALKLLMLTGARKGEVLSLKWDYVNFKDEVLNLPDSKTGKKTIVLSSAAVSLLKNIPKHNNPYVFCGKKPNANLVNLKGPWQRIREAAKLPDVRIHDLRHTFASHAINNGAPLETISKLLGHSQLKTTQRYAHLQNELLRKTANLVANSIS